MNKIALLFSMAFALTAVSGVAIAAEPVQEDKKEEDEVPDGLRYCSAPEAEASEGPQWHMSEGFPEKTQGHAAIYDSGRDELVLFGGREIEGFRTSLSNELWTFDGYRWKHRKSAAVGPVARVKHAMAYDEANQRVILFGGWNDQEGLLGDTWAWDGESWTEIESNSGRPAPRFLHAMSYDRQKQRVVLVGGRNRDGSLPDVWVLKDDRWSPLEEGLSGPGPREAHQLAYDSAGDQVVLFGGRNDAGVYDDLWALSGDQWSEVAVSGPRPTAREDHAMTYDSSREVVVVHGGRERWNGPRLGDSWEFDGQRWIRVADEWRGPTPRSSHTLTYFPTTGEILAISGRDQLETTRTPVPKPMYESVSNGDVWSWDGQIWTQRNGMVLRPAPREEAKVAYDETRENLVLHGGVSNEGGAGQVLMRDTWVWNGSAWRHMSSDGPPGAPSLMGYDSDREVVLMKAADQIWKWGGLYWERIDDDSIEVSDHNSSYDETKWKSLARKSGSPTPRVGQTIVYDEARHQSVLFGGEVQDDLGPGESGDTWVREHGRWTKAADAEDAPEHTGDFAMVYDREREVSILFAEESTWQWDGEKWSEFEDLAPSPPLRSGHAMAYDEERAAVILFGGKDEDGELLQDLWTFDGEGWEELESDELPSARSGHSMVWDSDREVVLLLGGVDADENLLGETWTWKDEEWEMVADEDGGPGPSEHLQLVNLISSQRVVALRSEDDEAQFWSWDGESWEKIETRSADSDDSPASMQGAALGYDELCGNLLLNGGVAEGDSFDEWRTWELFW